MTRKIVLVRSPRGLIENGQIGYGWAGLRFSDYETIDELLGEGIKNSGYKVGRKTKQIKRYFGLECAHWSGLVAAYQHTALVYATMLAVALIAHRYDRPDLAGSRYRVLALKTLS